MAEESSGVDGLTVERRRAIVDVMVGRAMEGDVRAAAFLFDRFYGRPAMAASPDTRGETEARQMDLRRLGIEELEAIGAILRGAGADEKVSG